MANDLDSFIEKARGRSLNDDEIRTKLIAGGWKEDQINIALSDELTVPPPPPEDPLQQAANIRQSREPLSVVENLTPKGFEYKIFSVSLIISLMAIIMVADILIGGSTNWDVGAFPLTALVVTGPVALFLFMRLRRSEIAQPALKHDPSRRKVVQAIQLVTFLAVIIHTIVLLYLIISGHYASSPTLSYDGSPIDTSRPNLASDIVRWQVTVVVAGGTFVYYWRDEHRAAAVL